MDYKETEQTTELVLQRMENSLNSLEQMSLDSINITDKLVMRIDELKKCAAKLDIPKQEQKCLIDSIASLSDELLTIAFEVNNVSHELEQETVYQHETLDAIKQIVSFLYAMSDV